MLHYLLSTALWVASAAHAGALDQLPGFDPAMPVPIPEARLLEERPAPSGRWVGVIINGDGEEPLHIGNAHLAKFVMKRHYGIAPEDLHFLSNEPRRSVATEEAVIALAAKLKATLGPGDHLVIYTTGHGVKDPLGTRLRLADGNFMRAEDFAKRFLDNRAADILFIGDQCYSGSFAQAMASNPRKRVVAISAVDCCHKVYCTFFIRPFFRALLFPEHGGRATEREAFDIANEQSRQSHQDLEDRQIEKMKGERVPPPVQWLRDHFRPSDPLPVAQYLVSGSK